MLHLLLWRSVEPGCLYYLSCSAACMQLQAAAPSCCAWALVKLQLCTCCLAHVAPILAQFPVSHMSGGCTQGVPMSKRFALVPMGPPLLSYSSTVKVR